jgi:ATP-dependent exoDNAse (exonuclease V) alpha subunit
MITEGRAGLGKSHQCIKKIIELEKQNINYVGLAFTNKAVLENNEKYKEMTGIDKKVFVLFDSYFPRAENEETYINKLKNKIILIDEYSMTPNKWMSLVYSSFIKNNNQVFMYGNMDQLPEIADNSKPINYLNSTAIRQMCPTVEELQWHKHARQDKKTFDILCNFIKTGRLETKLKKTGDYKYNISQLNETRKRITKKYANSGIKVTFKYQDKEEKYLVNKGCFVFGTCNNDKLNVVNNCLYTVKEINNEYVIINDDMKITLKEFGENYILGYCATTYKWQGATLTENYNIFDAKMMNKNRMYVALSRCRNIDQVHCDYIKDYYEPFEFANECEKIKPIKLKFGNIYCVEFTDNTYYIGETFKTVLERVHEHLNYKGKFTDTVFEKKELINKVVPIATIPVEDKAQLRQYETYYIQHYEKKYGSDNILNKKQKRRKLPEKKTKIEINKANKIEDNTYMKLSREEIAEKRFKITNDIKKMKLRIRYRDSNGKEKEISKKYNFDALDDNTDPMETALEYMQRRRDDLILDLYDL